MVKFPKDISIFKNSLYKYKDSWFYELDQSTPEDNYIQINKNDYAFTYLDFKTPNNKGGNSIILNLFQNQDIIIDTPKNPIYPDSPNRIIKIEKRPIYVPKFGNVIPSRFEKEIEALHQCNAMNFQNIIKIFEDGICEIYNPKNDKFDKHRFYTMEYAPYDLKNFIEVKSADLNFEIKLYLCLSLAKGLEELRQLNYYHRDIKPDNIFFVADNWKIGDLGLLAERNKQYEIDTVAESIGPKGWMSPESMNKYLTEGKGFPYQYDCLIDHRSDIFQLGKVYWYIFNFNAPIGCIKPIDMNFQNNDIYPIIRRMLNHNKIKRFSTIKDVIVELERISLKYLKSVTN